MRRGWMVSLMAVTWLAGSAPVWAQSPRRVGLVMGYPAALGVLWQVTDSVAVRPDVTLNRSTTETTSTTAVIGGTQTATTTSDAWTTSVGLSGLFYFGPAQDDLRFYLVPRAAYVWSSTNIESSPSLPQLGPYESDSEGFLVSGSLGAQYAVHERFRLFGELGLSYTTQESDTGYTLSRSRLETSSFGLRSGIGVMVYF
jgi:hypothetical protein